MSDTSRDESGSPDRFGFEWATYSHVLPESRSQLERWLGPNTFDDFKGRTVLDAGCGMGRNPYWYVQAGAVRVVASDVDDQSLNAARRNLADFKQAEVKKCSIYDLAPEVVGSFDRVTCIGVLHHLENPPMALAQMWSCVKPGGKLILWCYGRSGNGLLLPVIQAFRWIGSRLPVRLTHVLAKVISVPGWWFFKTMPWRTAYYRNLKNLSYPNFESIVFDQILPKIAHYWTESDMKALLAPLGGEVRLDLVQGNSWTATVTKKP